MFLNDIFFDAVLTVILFIFGLFVGSFVNVVIERTHFQMSWTRGRSRCPNCRKTLTWIELIPLISFIIQKGRCRSCLKKLSIQYPIMETIFGVVTVFVFANFGLDTRNILLLIVFYLYTALFISDLKYMEVPDILSIPAIILTFIYHAWDAEFSNFLVGSLIGFSFFFITYHATQGRGIGNGDMRLGAMAGMLVGFPDIINVLLLTYVSGALIAILLIATKKASRKSMIPLGVFLLPSAIIMFTFPEIQEHVYFFKVYYELL